MTRACVALAALLLAAPAHADALVDNVDGIALDKDGRQVRFTGILLSPQGKVVRLLARRDKRPERLDWRADLRGRVAVPGMVDAHGHVMALGFRALGLDLSDTASLEGARAKIAAFAAANPQRPWIIGGGWDEEAWGLGRLPAAADLDALTGDRPAWLERADGGAGWANAAAMRAAGVTAGTAAPAGGRIEKGPGGAPSGVFVGTAMALVAAHLPPPTPRDRDAAFLKAQDALLSAGVTATADMGTGVDDWLTYRRMGDSGQLRIRIISYAAGVEPAVRIAGQRPTPWLYADRLRMVGIALQADGALGSRGAWLKQPYADAPGQTGLPLLKDDQLLNLMSRGAMDGFQVAVRAVGDRANAQVLGAIEELAQSYAGDRRWRIEQAEVVDPADRPRFGRHGIVASVQPALRARDARMAQVRLGPARSAWPGMPGAGTRLAFGSGYPADGPSPFAGWAAAVTSGDAADGRPPQDGIGRDAAWRAFTADAAYAGFAEDRFGTLAPGMRADFVILDRDPTTATPADLRATQVLETWVGGEKMWERRLPANP